MEPYVVYLFYLAVLLILGILVTAVSNIFKVSNILFLVLTGYVLQLLGFSYFNDQIILVLSALALILIVFETTMELDLKHIVTNFKHMLKFNLVFFVLCAYILTLATFLVFDIPGKGFEVFVLCLLLSIIMYGVDPIIAMEFFHTRKNKIREMLEIEGIISGPVVVVFAFFVINYLTNTTGSFHAGLFSSLFLIGQQVLVAIILGVGIAWLLYKVWKNFDMPKELVALLVLATGIAVFVMGEALGSNGSLAVAIFGIFLRGLTKEKLSRTHTAVFAHTLYIIVFILFGIEFFFPHLIFWLKGLALFLVFLVLRFLCIVFFMKDIKWKEKLFMTLNVAKGIEVALVLFVMKIHFSDIVGLEFILSIGFMFFVVSYVLSTVVNHFSDYFLDR